MRNIDLIDWTIRLHSDRRKLESAFRQADPIYDATVGDGGLIMPCCDACGFSGLVT
jgi:hypothetical protein